MYVILFDATTGREVGRQQVANGRARADVAAANPEIYGASQSGFDVAFNIQGNDALTAALKAGHQLQVVARYTNDKQSGEGTFVHYFFAPQSFQQNLGYLDSLTMKTAVFRLVVGILATRLLGAHTTTSSCLMRLREEKLPG